MKPKILLAVSGSVAVIKIANLVQILKDDFLVKVIATPTVKNHYPSRKFVIEVEDQNLTSFPLHIEHAKWADLIVVAPASANTISKYINGIADNQVLATLLAARTPILFAPAMNTYMYQSLQKRHYFTKLITLNNFVIGPNLGRLWEGEIGVGRMSEPAQIQKAIKGFFQPNRKKILIVNGGSQVPIDAIRMITNRASGTLGKLLANELQMVGHDVEMIDVKDYDNQSLLATIASKKFDIYISPAAISDFTITPITTKIKKQDQLQLSLTKAIDIATAVAKMQPQKTIILFKHDNHKSNAITKLTTLGAKFIVWNKIGAMGQDKISGAIIFKNKQEQPFANVSKLELAQMIAKEI